MTQQPEYIGCIDGRAIVVRRQADEVVLTFDGVEARLSMEAAVRLANLLPSAASSPILSDNKSRYVRPIARQSRSRETIVDLMEENLIQVGTVLTLRHRRVDHFGTVTMDGKIDINGHKYDTPSGACRWVTGRKTCNGWAEWKVRDGRSLADLRWMLRAKRFPAENHGYAESTAREKQMIAIGWVDYALARGLGPGKKGNTETEAFLADRQIKSDYRYTESTLNVYRGHLRHWFEWCGDNNW